MTIKINQHISLTLINESHSKQIFDLIETNRMHLRKHLSFVDGMQTFESIENFVKGTIQRNKHKIEYAFVIFENEILVGRIGVYKIDNHNKIGEIGYWLGEHAQGKGIMTKSCHAILNFCFSELQLNRIEIKCCTNNLKSIAIPTKFNFTKEGVIKQGELLHNEYIDLNLYSLLKQNYKNECLLS